MVCPHLEPGLVPAGAVVECPGRCEEEHDGDERVEHHGEHQRDQVEQRDVREEHRDVHRGLTLQPETALRDLSQQWVISSPIYVFYWEISEN